MAYKQDEHPAEREVLKKKTSFLTPEQLQEFFYQDDDEAPVQGEASMSDYINDLEDVQALNSGSLLKGKIIKITGNEVYVDIAHKTEGVIPLGEYQDDAPPAVGDECEVLVVKTDENEGTILLSKNKAKLIKAWDKADEAFQNDGTIKCRIVAKVKGGLSADFNGLKAFVPGSLMSLQQEYDLEKYINQEFDFKIIEFNRRRRNMVLSRKAILEKERKAQVQDVLARLEPGQVCEGIVKNITDYGAFVSLEGGKIDGLLHKADMSWAHVRDISKVLQVGQAIEVKILNVDRATEKISLGLKQLRLDPWLTIDEEFHVGDAVSGCVKNITHFGAFVEIKEGIEGLVHISDMSWTERVRHPKELLEIDQVVQVKILNIDKDERKVALGMKQVHPDPWTLVREQFHIGQTVTGTVKNLTDFGAFVELMEGVEGLIHISDLSWVGRVKHPSEVVKSGDAIEVKILDMDPENKKISLGLKQVAPDPWEAISDSHPVGTIVEGKVKKLTDFGAFVELKDGIEGLIHISDFSWTERIEKPGDFLEMGQDVQVKVLDINKGDRKISLGLKQLTEEPWATVPSRYKVSEVVKGKVTKLTAFGAFVALEKGVEGLVHISDFSWTERVNHPSDYVQEGQEVDVRILEINRDDHKISLGLKQVDEDPFSTFERSHPMGSITEGEVISTTDFGAFVRLEGNIEGLVHASQISDDRSGRPEDLVTLGEKIQVKVLEVDKKERRIRLSMKQVRTDLDRASYQEYARKIEGNQEKSIGDVLDAETLSKLKAAAENKD